MKRKLGDTFRSKTRTAQVNELLMKVLCHNLICVVHEVQESGAVAMFPALAACTTNQVALPPAQQVLGLG
jgi:hypothetical protein